MAAPEETKGHFPSLSSHSEAAGTGLAEFLPIHTDVADPEHVETANHLSDEPTLSHALAMDDHEEKGAAQLDHFEEDVKDLGWFKKKEDMPGPLVGGLDNEELWLLIRRFNKQMYHVKEVTSAVPGNLDLNIADEEEFSPDKLRANVERLYMTVLISLLGATKHIARLRSWRETRRTTAFCAVYTVAWLFDFIVPLLVVTFITLIVYPPSRDVMFPPAPIALVDNKSGGVQKPKSGVLGSHDSATGAPENHKGEAVEQEASNFFNGITSVVITSATGKHPQGDPDSDGKDPGEQVPDPSGAALKAVDAKDIAAGGKPSKHHDKTKVPMETTVWTKMRPVMHGVADVSDTWERFSNALSPTPPFPHDIYRLRLAAVIAPLFFVSLFVTSYMFMKGLTFGVGFGFFGDPVITRGIVLLNRKFPHWQKLLELRNTILKGVPTNAQLTLTLLRIGEANKAPLPPAPRTMEAPPDRPAAVTEDELRATGADYPLNATNEELDEAIQHDPTVKHETDGQDIDDAKSPKHGRKGSKVVNFFKGMTKGGVKTTMGLDKVRAKAGSHHAKDRLGAAPKPSEQLLSGPVFFKGRHNGLKGHIYISTKATIPAVAFSTDSTIERIGTEDREDLHPLWSIPVADIKELKKTGGYGWKAKIVVGWSLGREVADALEIVDRTGKMFKITALPLRDELFNRLIAMGGQKWEAW
ncbi:hypothetical protein BKA67DRAFT_588836 [Truncatella angustata]|uniref:Uncharacterized protein n=1 Tax=Truncatella angustata TaxID=152316 RepID=A0A9P8RHP0_9PEZI|nr:uncharacterized protein BKA67DRAFT_588836 [Truncatella angustata]KAH6638553.1 hypothetical protein BKA67DRAFT_588836 [Truncatella angustata]KAH8199780.1 hypothetical protein TruAng_006061 [Truncatella angustata]